MNFIRSDCRGSDGAGQRRDEIRRNCGALVDGRSGRSEAADQSSRAG